MAQKVSINLLTEQPFPRTPQGFVPRVNLLTDFVKDYVEGYAVNRKRVPERVVLVANDYDHIRRRISVRLNREAEASARAEFHERRKSDKNLRWRDFEFTRMAVEEMTWGLVPLERGNAYSKPRPFEP